MSIVLYTWRPEDSAMQNVVTVGNAPVSFTNCPRLKEGELFVPHVTLQPVSVRNLPALGLPSSPYEPSPQNASALAVSTYLDGTLDASGSLCADSGLHMQEVNHAVIDAAFGDQSPFVFGPEARTRVMQDACRNLVSGKPARIQSGIGNDAAERRLMNGISGHILQNRVFAGMSTPEIVNAVDSAYNERIAENPQWKGRLLWERAMVSISAKRMLESGNIPEQNRAVLEALSQVSPTLERELLDPKLKLPMDFYAVYARGMLRADGIKVTSGNCADKAEEIDRKEPGSKHSFYARLSNTKTLSAKSRSEILAEEQHALHADGSENVKPVLVKEKEPITTEMLATAFAQVGEARRKAGRPPLTNEFLRLMTYTFLHECSLEGTYHTYKELKDGKWRYASTALGPGQITNPTRYKLCKSAKEHGINVSAFYDSSLTAEGNNMQNLSVAALLMAEEYEQFFKNGRERGLTDDQIMTYYGLWHFGNIHHEDVEGDKRRDLMTLANRLVKDVFAHKSLDEINGKPVITRMKAPGTVYVANMEGPVSAQRFETRTPDGAVQGVPIELVEDDYLAENQRQAAIPT